MENEFLPYELAVEMKSIGFDEPCLGYFASKDAKTIRLALWTHIGYVNANRLDDDLVTAPIYQQVFRWFREKHNLLGNVYSNASGWLWEIHDNEGGTHRFGSEWSGDCEESGMFTSFEKAEIECVKRLISIIKEKK